MSPAVAVGRLGDVVPGEPQGVGHAAADGRLIFDDDDAGLAHHVSDPGWNQWVGLSESGPAPLHEVRRPTGG